MQPTGSVVEFEKMIEASGSSLAELIPEVGVKQMLSFFETTRAEGCAGTSQDMLLFEWGTYNWGDGEFFELSISRQFIESEAEDAPEISQLRLVFKYANESKLSAFQEGNRWCSSRDELSEFKKYIQGNPAFRAVAVQQAPRVGLSHSYV